MPQRPNRLMLLIVVLALAMAPLRGTLALPVPASADDTPHCADMQQDHAMPGMHHMDDTADTGQPCQSGCEGDCCDNACYSCVHPATALLDDSLPAALAHRPPLKITRSSRFFDRTVIPPLRPPASP